MEKPADLTPSRFLVDCIGHCFDALPNKLALDLPAGYGRHSIYLKQLSLSVIAADIDETALQNIPIKSIDGSVLLDAESELPFAEDIFGLAVIVHYWHPDILRKISRTLSPGGYVIYESFGAHGKNWIGLPVRGEVQGELDKFEILKVVERPAGPDQFNKTLIKVFARKL